MADFLGWIIDQGHNEVGNALAGDFGTLEGFAFLGGFVADDVLV